MDVTIQTYQAFLDDAWDTASDDEGSLRAQLRSFERNATSLWSASGSIFSVSKNSATQSYRGPGLGSYTLVQISNVWRDLINLFDKIKRWADLAIAKNQSDAPANSNDATIYDLMKQTIVEVNEVSSDISELFLTPTLTPPPLTSM